MFEFIIGESYEDKDTGKCYLCIEEIDKDIPNDYAIGVEEVFDDEGEVIDYGNMIPFGKRANYYWL